MLPTMEIVLAPGGPGTSNVPAFLAKLWKMVDDPGTNHLISWSDEGSSFIIHNQAEFAQSLLPYYYKHSNMASFVRQLNMYGFHKVVGIESGGLKSEKQEEMEFAHGYFIRGMEILLDKIKRKVSANKSATYAPAMKTERVNEVLNEVSIIRDRQEDLDSKLDTMKKENEALWREVVNLRQKHQAQQKIVNKLIHFLVSMVQPRMGQAVKRRYPNQLAVEDAYEPSWKDLKLEGEGGSGFDLGPIISEVTQETVRPGEQSNFFLPNEMVNIEMPDTPEAVLPDQSNAASQIGARPPTPVTAAMRAVDPTLVNPSINSSWNQTARKGTPTKKSGAITAVVTPKRPAYNREISKEDIDIETNFLQKDLDNLKDILSGQITIDSSFLSSLFNPEDPLPNLVFPGGSQASSTAAETFSTSSNPAMLKLELDNGGPPQSFFELADMDDDSLVVSPRDNSGEDFSAASLNTPLVFADQTDPLVAQLKK